jgi:hypothetical protein
MVVKLQYACIVLFLGWSQYRGVGVGDGAFTEVPQRKRATVCHLVLRFHTLGYCI